MRSRICLLGVGLSLLFAAGARADDDTEATFDKYSKLSEQKLLLTGEIKYSIPEKIFRAMYSDLGLNRFNMTVKAKDPNDPAVEAWCEKAIKDTQVRKDEVDGETGDAVITLKAKMDRCSQVFKHDLNVTHTCKVVRPKKGKPYMECKMVAVATIYKYKASQASGKLTYVLDTKFGRGGKIIKKSDGTGSGTLQRRTSEQAKFAALDSAKTVTGLFLKRRLRDIKEFQLSAPVVRAKSGIAYGCLGRDTTELDTPFHIVLKAGGKEKRVGFVKARKIYDGCTETPSMREKKNKKWEIKPFEAQIILGGSDIKPGHTFWEMPSIGLNVGGYAGLAGTVGFFDGNLGVGGGLAVEFNLAPYLGVSELHSFLNATFAVNTDGDQIMKEFEKIQTLKGLLEGAPFAIQSDLGILKRFYFAGPIFADVGVAFAFSYYVVSTNVEDLSVGLMSIGGALHTAIGFQLTGRMLLKLNLGFRAGMTLPSATYKEEDVNLDNMELGAELGPFARIVFLYNI